jgi:hypothetical protein
MYANERGGRRLAASEAAGGVAGGGVEALAPVSSTPNGTKAAAFATDFPPAEGGVPATKCGAGGRLPPKKQKYRNPNAAGGRGRL